MLPDQILCLLSFFDAFGCNSGTSKLFHHKNIATYINFIQIGLIPVFAYFQVKILIQMASQYEWIEFFNQALQFSATVYAYSVIVIDSILQKRNHRQFWKIIQIIDSGFTCPKNYSYRHFSIKMITYFAGSFTCFMTNLTLLGFLDNLVYFEYYFLIKICQVKVFYFIFCVEVLRRQLKIVEMEMEKIVKGLNNSTQVCQLGMIRRYYHHIYGMSTYLNKVFGRSLLATIPFCFFVVLTNLNYYYGNYGTLSSKEAASMLILLFSSVVTRNLFWKLLLPVVI